MPRPQFSIRTLFWLTLVVAAFLGGMAVQRQLDSRKATIVLRVRQDAKYEDVVNEITTRARRRSVEVTVAAPADLLGE